jgi:hypothetical protein
MKKTLAIALLAVMTVTAANAQEKDSQWTLNTRFWCTNYFTTLIGAATHFLVTDVILDDSSSDSQTVKRILPCPDLVFPVGIKKEGFSDNEIYGPYHRAFSNPFKYIGDYAVGIDASWKPSFIGLYAGTYFKSQEIVFKETKDNLRGYYFQPRAGLLMGGQRNFVEAGVFYDIPTGCTTTGEGSPDKDLLKEGVGLDFALTTFGKNESSSFTLQFSMPLHDMLKDSPMKRRVGYIMLTRRVKL